MPEFSLNTIAEKIGASLHGAGNVVISGAAEISKATPSDITFLANPRYKSQLASCRAGAVIIDSKTDVVPEIPYLLVEDAYFAFLQTFLMLHPQENPMRPGIHPSAVIDESANIGRNTAIGANVYIGANVSVGDRSQIFPNCVILDNCRVGEDCRLYPGVTVRENCEIGNRVILHNGVVIGSDGFGFAPHQGKMHKIPQVGRVVIKDDVEIGANSTIDRATLGETVIESGVKLDNLVHIAHNVVVGEHTVMAAQTGISGSTRIGRNVMIGGQVGVVGHISIGDRAQIGAQSGVAKSVPEGEVFFGYPARPIRKTMRIDACLNNLPELVKRVRALEKALAKLNHNSEE